jgi:hypothetical protein
MLTAFSLAEIAVLWPSNDDREEVVDRLEEDPAAGVDHLEEDQAAVEGRLQPFPEVEAYHQLALVEEPRLHLAAAVRRMHLVEGHRMRLVGGLVEEEEV